MVRFFRFFGFTVKLFFRTIPLIAVSQSAQAWVNPGFETGDLSGWSTSFGTGTNPTCQPNILVVGPGPAPHSQGTLCAAPAICLNQVRTGNFAAQLDSCRGDNDHVDWARIEQTDLVPSNGQCCLSFWFAAILSGHHYLNAEDYGSDAYIMAEVLVGGSVVASLRYSWYDNLNQLVDDGADPFGGPEPVSTNGPMQWRHLPWTPFSINLCAYAGQQATIRLTVYDCDLGGHNAFGYLDDVSWISCPDTHLSLVKSNNPPGALSQGATITYTLNYANNGTNPISGVIISDTVPTGTSLVPGSVSSAPTIPNTTVASDAITWNIGYLSPGSSGTLSFQVVAGNPCLIIPNVAREVDLLNPNGILSNTVTNTVGGCTPTSTRTSSPTPTRTNTAVNTPTLTTTPSRTSTPSSTRTMTSTSFSTASSTSTTSRTPTASATPTRTPTSSPTATTSSTSTRTATASGTATASLTSTTVFTRTATSTATGTSSRTSTLVSTATNTSTSVFTRTTTSTSTAARTSTSTPTGTSSGTSTGTRTSTPSATSSPTSSATATFTTQFTRTSTSTSVFTNTRSMTPTSSLTATRTGTSSSTATAVSTSTLTSTSVFTRTGTATSSVTRTSTATFTPTVTRTATGTSTASQTSTDQFTRTATSSRTPSPTSSMTASATATSSRTATSSLTSTLVSTSTFTRTSTATASGTPTMTLTATLAFSATSTSTRTLTASPTQTSSSTLTSSRTSTPTFTATATASVTSTRTSTSTATDSRTATASATSSPTSTLTQTRTATSTPTSTATPTSTSTPTATPTPTPGIYIAKIPSGYSVGLGATVTYNIALTVIGSSAFNVQVTDHLPADVDFTGFGAPVPSVAGQTMGESAGILTWTFPSLNPGVYKLPYSVRVHDDLLMGTTLLNNARIDFSGGPSRSVTAAVAVPAPYHVHIALYNEAGELVRTLLNGDFFEKVETLDLSGAEVTSLNGVISIYVKGRLAASWDGRNANGDPVSNGSYHLKLDNLDAYGVMTNVTKTITVNRVLSTVTVKILNEAGEVVRNLYEKVEDAADGVPQSVNLTTNVIRPNGQAGSGASSSVTIRVDLPTGSFQIAWDGTNDQGQIVSNGQYFVETRWLSNGEDQVVVKQVGVVSGGSDAAKGKVTAQPNILTGGQTTTVLSLNSTLVFTLRVKLYNIAGELTKTTQGTPNSNQVTLDCSGLASGYYLAVTELYGARGMVERQVVPLVIKH